MNRKINNNQGQVLLIVVVAMAVTLGVGLGITSRNTDSLRRTGNLDSFQKVTAAAEGGLERFLIKSDTELEEYLPVVIVPGETSPPEEIIFNNGTTAFVTVHPLSAGSAGMIFEEIKPSEVVTFLTTEFSFANPDLVPTNSICLKFDVVPSTTKYMLNVVTSNPNVEIFEPIEDNLITNNTFNSTKTNIYLMESYLSDGNSNFKSPAPVSGNCSGSGFFEFKNSFLVRFHPLSNTVDELRISVNSTNSNARRAVQNIIQGYKITSTGRFSDGIDRTSRTIEAFKYLDTPAATYDYAMFLDN